jgi:peptide/nickel transport system permease protein
VRREAHPNTGDDPRQRMTGTVTLPELVPAPVARQGAVRTRPQTRRQSRLLVSYVLTVFVLVTLNFFLPRALPGDPLTVLTAASSTRTGGVTLDAATKAKVAHYYGLDRSLASQYWHYLSRLGHGDLGFSIRYNVPVAGRVLGALRWTGLLVLASMVLAVGIGAVAGIHSGWHRGRRLDRGLLALFVCLGKFPVFVLASFALIVFAVKLHWAPLALAETPFVQFSVARRAVDVAHHLVLPAAVMAVQYIFLEFMVVRGGMVSELGSDHLLLGRAKGLRDRRLKYRYAARNALLPIVTIVGLDISAAVGGTIFVERVFAYPGLGKLMFDSIAYLDYPTMQACFLVLSLVVVTVNLLTDLVYPRLDPRVEQ